MILLTGATGLVGAAVLRRLTRSAAQVRCLVRDPRQLGDQRVNVQIALGDLAEPQSFRHALRGVETVVHLAASIRDQGEPGRGCSIEELNGVGTWRLVEGAERAGVKRLLFISSLGASTLSSARFLRAKAMAEEAVVGSGLDYTVFAPSAVYAQGDAFLRLFARLSLLPVVPLSGRGEALFQPIWAEDVAECVMAVINGGGESGLGSRRYELGGPETISYAEMVDLAIRAAGRRRSVVSVPLGICEPALRVAQLVAGRPVVATQDEVALLEVTMTTPRGTADAQALGVSPRAMAAVLGIE
ncbi:MAG: NAD(P)H-binding protein [Solirubrobacterales bacterium]|nr:NAD(P)H-binding protein [Solirubrobacterales bacterium]